jgi:chitodextrinase
MAGYVYVTDDVPANPYDRLPPDDYLTAEQSLATALPGTALVPPRSPRGLDSVDYTSTTITMSWRAATAGSAPVVAYDIFRDGVRVASVPGIQTSFVALNLTPLTTYQFAVVARDALGQVSDPSAPLTETTDETFGDPPPPPKAWLSGVGFTSASLTWQQKTPNDKPPIDGFVVLQNGRPILRLPASARSVTVGKLAPDSTYTFAIVAVDATGGTSRRSSGVTATTPALPDDQMIASPVVNDAGTQISYSADFLVPFAFRRVFIATGDPAHPCWSTGSTPQICADFVIENDRLLAYSGTGTDWTWTEVRSVSPTITGATYSWTLDATDIGSPATPVSAFNANGYAPNTYCGLDVACISVGPPLPYE